eukprot:495852-Rhodomonas_salina.2
MRGLGWSGHSRVQDIRHSVLWCLRRRTLADTRRPFVVFSVKMPTMMPFGKHGAVKVHGDSPIRLQAQ